MSRSLKRSIKNNGIIKAKKKVKKFTNKSGLVLLNNFLLSLSRTQRSYHSTHPLHKHEQLRAFPVFRYGRNELYDQNIPYYKLLGLIIDQFSLFSDYSQH